MRPLEIFAAIFVAAGLVYSFHLGTDALGASEAYSAWAAAKPGLGAIVRTPVLHDPGKQVFYYVVLHYYTRIFGLSEISLRSMSVIFSLTTLVLVFALGREMFDDNTALAAAAMWAFNPLAVVFAHTARMYSMLIAIALAQLLMLWRVRSRPSVSGAVACGMAGAAMLYTHMGGMLFIGAGVAMLVRDYFHGRKNQMAWMAIALTLVLFVPYVPVARAQSETLIAGHWLDWIGTAIRVSTCDQSSCWHSRRARWRCGLWLAETARLGRRPARLAWRMDDPAGTHAGGGVDRDPADVQPALRCAVNSDARVVDRGRIGVGQREVAQPAGGGLRAGMLDRAAVRPIRRRSRGEISPRK